MRRIFGGKVVSTQRVLRRRKLCYITYSILQRNVNDVFGYFSHLEIKEKYKLITN